MLKVLEQILDNEMDSDLGYEKHSLEGINNDNSHNSKFPKKIQTEHGKAVIDIPRNRKGEFEPIIAPKHQSRGLSIEKLIISLYAKGLCVSDIEEETNEVNEINLSIDQKTGLQLATISLGS